MKVALLLVGGVVVGLIGLFLYLLRFHTYLGDDPSACVNCHIMASYYATWMHGAHARNTTCNDCHVPHDNVFRKYYFKGKDGMNHVYKFVTRQERQAIRAIDESAEVIMENCVRCHATLNTELVNTGRITYMDAKCGAGQACWDCHRDVAHGKMNSLSLTKRPYCIRTTLSINNKDTQDHGTTTKALAGMAPIRRLNGPSLHPWPRRLLASGASR